MKLIYQIIQRLRDYVPIIILSDSDVEMEVCDTECVPTHFEGMTTEAGEASESVPTLSEKQTAEKEMGTESVPTLSEEEANQSGGEKLNRDQVSYSSDEVLDEFLQDVKGKRKAKEVNEEPMKKRRRSTKKKTVSSLPPPPVDQAFSEVVYFEKDQESCELLFQRKLITERSVDLLSYKPSGFSKFLESMGIKNAATNFLSYNKHLVCEMYANLQEDILERDSPWFRRVYVRGMVIEFSAERLNELLGLQTPSMDGIFEDGGISDNEILKIISGGVQVAWPRIGHSQASCLTSRFFGLYQIAVHCWLPSSNTTALTKDMAKLIFCVGTQKRVNLGLLIFQAIVKLVVTTKAKMALIHPCLLTELARSQGVSTKSSDEVVEPEMLKANKRTFGLRKVHDLSWNPKKAVDSMDKADMKTRLNAINARLGALLIQKAAIEAEMKALEDEKIRLKQ